MKNNDFEIVCGAIEKERKLLMKVSQVIWKTPELAYEEIKAHSVLTDVLSELGFDVQKHYVLETAFKAEYTSQSGGGPVVAILLEYDALPKIGHACGHNLIAEAGLAAAIGIRAAMINDPDIKGKLMVIGSPAEENGGGKIQLINAGVFEKVDVALMVHPCKHGHLYPLLIACVSYTVEYKGKEAHAAGFPWEGINALDAAVSFYQSLALLRQQIKPTSKISAIITDGGTVTNIIPSSASLRVQLRDLTSVELTLLRARVEACARAAAAATGCEVQLACNDGALYDHVEHNKVLGSIFQTYAKRLGMFFKDEISSTPIASTDFGNISHKLPSLHPLYAIETKGVNHTIEFSQAAGAESAQEPTLLVSKAMAMTALEVMRDPNIFEQVKKQFQEDSARLQITNSQ